MLDLHSAVENLPKTNNVLVLLIQVNGDLFMI